MVASAEALCYHLANPNVAAGEPYLRLEPQDRQTGSPSPLPDPSNHLKEFNDRALHCEGNARYGEGIDDITNW